MHRQLLSIFLSAGLLTAADASIQKGLSVTVLQGDAVTHAMPNPAPAHVSIRVTDNTTRPIQGAVAVFEFPESGPSALLADGSNVKAVLTDSDGKASIEVRSNTLPGAFEPTITVNYLGQSTLARLHQSNVVAVTGPTISHSTKSSRKWYYIAAAAAGGAVAIMLLTKGKTAAGASSGGGITITPGSGSVGGK